MKIFRKALDARWFLLVITIALCSMVAVMYLERTHLEAAPSEADLRRSSDAREKMKTLVPGNLGESIAKELAGDDKFRVASAQFVSQTRIVLSWLAFLGLLGCIVDLSWWIRKRLNRGQLDQH